jgi:hypothetical protein
MFKLKKIGTGKHLHLSLHNIYFAQRTAVILTRTSAKTPAQKLYLRIQSDSKLLSGFLSPIIFKQETTKQNCFRKNKGVHVEVV